jgi:Zn-dependent protease
MSSLPRTTEEWFLFAGVVFLILMSNACHEAGHALSAYLLGDRRAEVFRRATLNPLPHIHWLYTVVLPFLSMLLLGWILGGAKPVRVDAGTIGPRRMALVALAGPLANFLFAGFFIAILGFLIGAGWVDGTAAVVSPWWKVLKPAIWFSLILGLFNLLPFPPLDGGHVLAMFLPDRARRVWYALSPAGIILALALTLWVGGTLAGLGLGRGWPEIYELIASRAEDNVFAMAAFWRNVL